jgi:hypothetical protein
MITFNTDKVITYFYMDAMCLSVVQDGKGNVLLLQLTEVPNE